MACICSQEEREMQQAGVGSPAPMPGGQAMLMPSVGTWLMTKPKRREIEKILDALAVPKYRNWTPKPSIATCHTPPIAAFSAEDVPAEAKEFVICETLLHNIAQGSAHKIVYRARVAPFKVQSTAANNSDDLLGGKVSLRCTKRGKDLEGHDSVVLLRPKVESFEEFEKESQILQKLQHKNIIGLIAAFSDDNYAAVYQNNRSVSSHRFMAVEAVRPLGNDLVSYTDKFTRTGRKVPIPHIVLFLEQLVEALAYMHSMNIYHRDLKPDNVLINEEFTLKLIDFGLASVDGKFKEVPDTVPHARYFAPDVNTPSSCVDYWGVGVLIWHMVSKHSYGEVRSKVERGSRWIDDIVWPETSDLLQGLLKLKPEERWGKEDVESWLQCLKIKRSQSHEVEGEDVRSLTIPYAWPLNHGKAVFCVTLPQGFRSKTLGDLKLNTDVVLIVMMDQREAQLGCYDWLCYPWKGTPSKPEIVVEVGRDTLLKPGSKLYFGLDPNTADEQLCIVLDQLDVAELATSARRFTAETAPKRLQQLANELQHNLHSNLIVVMPTFEAFKFPDHCAEAVLGYDRKREGRNNINLRNKFDIPVAAIASEDGTVRKWWPGPAEVIKRGDQGLVMTKLWAEHSNLSLGDKGVSVTKLQALVDEEEFQRKLGLSEEAWKVWQTKSKVGSWQSEHGANHQG